MANINIFSLGGQDENGKNCFVIEVNNDIFVVNTGIQVPINSRYGIDGIIPSFQYLQERQNRIKGIFITHAHDDSFAALPWLLMNVKGAKIYASKFTNQAIQERVSKYSIGNDSWSLNEIKGDMKFGSVNVKTFSLANSIPGSLAFNFQTPDGDIVVMSNFIIDDLGPFGKTDLDEIKKGSKEIIALLCDSGRSNFQGKSSDHKSVLPILEKEFMSAAPNERIVIGGYDEEMYVLQELMELAIKTNRPVALYGRAFSILFRELVNSNKGMKIPHFIDYKEANNHDNAVIFVTGTWSRIYQRFIRIVEGEDVYLKFRRTDHILFVAPPINGLEVLYSEALDKVAEQAPNITEVTFTDYYSLRPAAQDIYDVVKFLQPKYFLPISALYRYLVTSRKIAEKAGVTQDRNIILYGGKIANFIDGKLASQKARLKEYGETIIDGFGVGDISHGVIRERESLSAGGLVSIAVQIQRNTNEILMPMNIQLVGVVVKERLQEIQDKIQNIVIQKIQDAPTFDIREIQNSIKKKVQKVLMKLINKEPLVVSTFYII